MSLFYQKSHALIVQKPFFVALNTRDLSLLKENLLSNKRYPYSIQTSRVQMTAFSLLQKSLATYCLFMEPLLYGKTKTWLGTRANFVPRIFKRKSLELLLLEFGRKTATRM